MSDDAQSHLTVTLTMQDYLLLREALAAHVAYIQDMCRHPSHKSVLRHQLEKFEAVRMRTALDLLQMEAADPAGAPKLAALEQEFDGDEG